MRLLAGIVLDQIDAGMKGAEVGAAMRQIPAWQWRTMWQDLAPHCEQRHEPSLERRPVNGLNVEIGTPLVRCLLRSPDGLGLRYLYSGGSALAYGLCEAARCPVAEVTPRG